MGFEKLEKEISNAPTAWLAQLLAIAVITCIQRRVFPPGNMIALIKKLEERHGSRQVEREGVA